MKTNLLLGIILFLLPGTLFAQERGVTPSNHPTIQPSNHPATTYAVVVGISDYQNDRIPDLRFADKDAEAFARFLQSPAGGSLDNDHLKVLINDRATQAQLGAAFGWLWEVVEEGDQVIIYFSGHGDVEQKSLTQSGYLLCWDSPASLYMSGGAFPLNALKEVVSTLSVVNKAQVILISDACRSGKLAGSDIHGAQLTSENLRRQYENEIKILSCQPHEYSIEGEQWGGGRGAFSYHLVDGLYGMADGNQDLSVDLMEIGRYLQDKVSKEVAPESQIPITVGNFTEKLVQVNPGLLEQIREGKKGQLQQFSPAESRGIEEDILATLDSMTRERYVAFRRALEDRQFFEPENACAEAHFNTLIHAPGLERLRSTLLRNYAAALQDDAQQVLNKILSSDPSICLNVALGYKQAYQHIPRNLKRAAELLGEQHYMYRTLLARKIWFESYLLGLGETPSPEALQQQLDGYRKALEYQPEMPHAWLEMGYVFSERGQLDSAEYYFDLSLNAVPEWLLPYTYSASYYITQANYEKAGPLLEKAWQIDSNAVVVLHAHGYRAMRQGNSKDALRYGLRSLRIDPNVPCTYVLVGGAYFWLEEYDKAETVLKKGISIDSNFSTCSNYLRMVYIKTGKLDEAIATAMTAIEMEPFNALNYNSAGWTYVYAGYFDEAEEMFRTTIAYQPHSKYYVDLGFVLAEKRQFKQAEQQFKTAIATDSTDIHGYMGLYLLYMITEDEEAAARQIEIAMKLNKELTLERMWAYLKGRVFKGLTWNNSFTPNNERFFIKLAVLYPDDPLVLFEYAEMLAELGKTEEAYRILETALEKGYSGYYLLQMDDFLQVLREQKPRWNALMKKYFPEKI